MMERRTLVIHEIPLQGCYRTRDVTLAQSHSTGSGIRACTGKSGQVDYGGAQSVGMANTGE
jgi:hypothetical protein